MAILDQTLTDISNTTFANNRTTQYGGAVFAQGSTLNITTSRLINNEVSPGVNEAMANSYGAALFTTGWDSYNLPATGTVSNSVISDNIGLPIFDDDRTNGPINDMRYNGNQIYSTTFGTAVYTDALGISGRTVAQLNSLVVNSRQRRLDRQVAGEQHRAGERADVRPSAGGAADDALHRRRRRQPAAERRVPRLRLGRRQRHARRQRG